MGTDMNHYFGTTLKYPFLIILITSFSLLTLEVRGILQKATALTYVINKFIYFFYDH